MKLNNFIYYSNSNDGFQALKLSPGKSDKSFVVGSFNGDIQHFNFEETNLQSLDFSVSNLKDFSGIVSDKSHHVSLVDHAIKNMEENGIFKVVLSRQHFINGQFDILHVLKSLQSTYPTTFVYCLRLNNTMWIGASPEILVKGENHHFETYALAGTKKVNETFTQKEKDEQAFVSQYIIEKLHESQHVTQGETVELKLKNIKHLLSVISFENQDIFGVVKKLHPTPAVLGVPSDKAMHFIRKNENHVRDLYTGFIGFYSSSSANVYVNLRCGQVFHNGISLYTGGGITKDSVAEDEWNETENKVATFTKILNEHSVGSI